MWSGEKRVSASNYWPPAKVSGDQFFARQCQLSKKIAQSECVLQRSHQIQQMSGLFQLAQKHDQHCSGVSYTVKNWLLPSAASLLPSDEHLSHSYGAQNGRGLSICSF